jgi:hypothetical protein
MFKTGPAGMAGWQEPESVSQDIVKITFEDETAF